MRKKQTQKEQNNMEVLILDSGYVPQSEKKQTEKGGMFLSFLVLFGAVGVLAGSLVSAFSIRDERLWLLIPGIFLFSLFFSWFYADRRLDSKRIYGFLAIVILYMAVCFVLQNRITAGFYQTADFVMSRINQVYHGNMRLYGAYESGDMVIFWLPVLFPVTGLLGAGIVRRRNWLLILSILFPLVALMMIAGGRPGNLWMYFLAMSILLLFTAGRSYFCGWKAGLTALLAAVVVSVPSWCISMPLAGVEIPAIQRGTTRIQNRLLQSLWSFLPKISGGNLQLSLEGIAGGVDNGELGTTDGVFFTGVDALKVTSVQRPSETVYLRGYIGETYTGNSFEPGAEENFQNAAAVWKTDGDSSIYIQNLPFLRTMYYEKQSSGKNAGESESAVNQITVENLNANPEYTYVPYDAFLNDVYQISNGDGAVCGQSRQDDIFSCYWRSNAKEILESYRDGKDTSGVLNDTEKSYRNFCSTYDLQIPEKGLERLKKECAEAKEENHWGESETGAEMPDWAVADEYEEIRKYVVKRLLRDCSYETDTDKLKDGQDFVETFLYDTKEGYSMHFAAAATMMFRMFGVPARYVVGYVAPQELFSENADQTYTAVLEDDNAHTWVEIYQPFLGWTPVEVTPGMETEFVDQTEEKEQSDRVPEEAKTETEEEEISVSGFAVRIAGWFTGHLADILKLCAVLCLLMLVLGSGIKIRAAHRARYGAGEDPAEAVRAIYRYICRILYKKGMSKDCTAADGGTIRFIRDFCPVFTEEDGNRLQELILRASYGNEPVTEEERLWMRQLCRQIKRSVRGKKR